MSTIYTANRGKMIGPYTLKGNVFTQMKDADAADEQAYDHGAGFHDRAAETLAENDGCEDGEAESDVLGAAAPGECVRGPNHIVYLK